MVQLLPTGSHEIVNIINSIESSESFINSESVIYIDANPNKIISAPIGSIFYRRGQECYVARKIAIDHLKEDPNYYTKLKNCMS